MSAIRLQELARVIRSKNAGPFEITFDVIFADADNYERVKRSGALTAAYFQKTYNVAAEDVLVCMFFDPAMAFKATLRRSWAQGSIGERDTFGAQQHAPLYEVSIAC